MVDWLLEFFTSYPYLGVTAIFLLCGLGFPLPEEIVLFTAGYVCFKGFADLPWMMLTCAGAILAGDLVPFFLGRTFGTRLLRLRPLRVFVTTSRLATFDRWFRRRGDLVIFIARFVTGLRIVAYFAAGTMKMTYRRFIILDLLGIGVVVPAVVFFGKSAGTYVDSAIDWLQAAERWILIGIIVAAVLTSLIIWLRKRRKNQASEGPSEAYVAPSREIDTAIDEGEVSARPAPSIESPEPPPAESPLGPTANSPGSPLGPRGNEDDSNPTDTDKLS